MPSNLSAHHPARRTRRGPLRRMSLDSDRPRLQMRDGVSESTSRRLRGVGPLAIAAAKRELLPKPLQAIHAVEHAHAQPSRLAQAIARAGLGQLALANVLAARVLRLVVLPQRA